ncbi:MAG: hypothetical protein Q8P19_00635 [bacterium]|nr:hypothetical protein [bacterium]
MESHPVVTSYVAYFTRILSGTLSKPSPAKLKAVLGMIRGYAKNTLPILLMSRDEARLKAERHESEWDGLDADP